MSLLKIIQEVQEEWDRGQEAESESAYVSTKKDERSPLSHSVVNSDGSLLTSNPASPPWPPRPAELSGWSIDRRQRWGELANRLEDEGVMFPESERQAFMQVKAEV
jgi:hypothetical protein